MEGHHQGNLNDSFGEDSHLYDGQEASLDIWWNQPGIQEEVATGVQEFVPVLSISLPDQQVVVNEEVGVDDMNSYFMMLNEDGGGDDLVQWNLERIFDNVPNPDRDHSGQHVNGLYLLQELYQSPPPSPVLPPSSQLPLELPEVLEPQAFSGVVPASGNDNLEIPAVESISFGQAPAEEIGELASEGLTLEEVKNPAVFLEHLPPRVLEQGAVIMESSPSRPAPLVESPLKSAPCLELNHFNKHHAPPPLIRRPEVHQLPPPPPLEKRPEVKNLNPRPTPSLYPSWQSLDDAAIRSRPTRGSKRKKFISHSAPPTLNVEVKERSKKSKRNPPKKKVKSFTTAGWVEDDVWEYEKIMEASLLRNVSNSPKHGNKKIYYVKWKGWSSDYNSWIREKDFVDPWPLGQFWKSTLEDINKLNRKVIEIRTAAPTPQPNYFL